MTRAVTLDIETLGHTPTCVILTVGAIKFDPHGRTPIGPSLYLRLDIEEQLALSRTVDDSTLEWWSKQDRNVLEEALMSDERVSLDDFRQQFNKFLFGVDDIWAQGPVFDITVIENLYRSKGWSFPWNYWQIRDSRTLFGVHGDCRKRDNKKMHNALEDCISQTEAIISTYKKIHSR